MKDREDFLDKMFGIIKDKPGIRPNELNKLLGKEHTNHYRKILINRGLIVKRRKGSAVYYFPVGEES